MCDWNLEKIRMDKLMPVPDRGRTKKGRWRKKRTDAGKQRRHAKIRHGMRWLFET